MEGGIRLCLGGDAAYPQIAVAVNFLAVIVDIPEILAGGHLLDFIHDKHGAPWNKEGVRPYSRAPCAL